MSNDLPFSRDELGRLVREAWVRWARKQPNPKSSWLVPYDELPEADKEADRQIGEAVAICATRRMVAMLNTLVEEGETYTSPPHGWTCFHCGETFATPGSARDHFGPDCDAEAACRIKFGAERSMVKALRRAERDAAEAWGRLNSESSDFAKAYFAAVSRHNEQIRLAEEVGYERGLEDGRKEAQAT